MSKRTRPICAICLHPILAADGNQWMRVDAFRALGFEVPPEYEGRSFVVIHSKCWMEAIYEH
jgi:hypothetical protein